MSWINMKRVSTKVFANNRTQAVRLPKSVALPDHVRKVEIIVSGTARMIIPEGECWDRWFSGPLVTADFAEWCDGPREGTSGSSRST